MPTPTYTPLANVTLGSSAASVTFSSIPATYRDLVLVMVPLIGSVAQARYRVNGLETSIYSYVGATGSGGSTFSYSGTEDFGRLSLQQSQQIGRAFYTLQFMDYSATDKHKTVLTRKNDPNGGEVNMNAGRVATTAAITSILVFNSENTFSAGSTFELYGIAS
jgi:hypothetical protein